MMIDPREMAYTGISIRHEFKDIRDWPYVPKGWHHRIHAGAQQPARRIISELLDLMGLRDYPNPRLLRSGSPLKREIYHRDEMDRAVAQWEAPMRLMVVPIPFQRFLVRKTQHASGM